MSSPPRDQTDDVEAAVRRGDPDRWLASRFIADPADRADVLALYAFDLELARIAPMVSQPLIGEIRLAWWREALEEIFADGPARRHPAAEALQGLAQRRGLPQAPLEAMIDARSRELDPGPFAAHADLFAYLDGRDGAVMAAAAHILGAPAADLASAGRAWGVATLARDHWAGAPSRLPPDWTAADVEALTETQLSSARAVIATLPVRAFPAIAHLALARPYARRGAPSLLAKQLRLLWATLRGQV